MHNMFRSLLLQQHLPLQKQVWKSRPAKPQKVSEQTLDKQSERVLNEDIVMNEGRGRSCWVGDKHYNLNYLFSKVSTGLEPEHLQTSLTVPGPQTIYRPDVPHDVLISRSDTHLNIHDAVSSDYLIFQLHC